MNGEDQHDQGVEIYNSTGKEHYNCLIFFRDVTKHRFVDVHTNTNSTEPCTLLTSENRV